MPLLSQISKSAALALIASLSACASVNPVGLARLAALDPLSADPEQISVAARLPQALKLRTGDLMMVVKTNDEEAPEKIDETFYLAVRMRQPAMPAIDPPEAGERLQTARVAPADIAAARHAGQSAPLKVSGGARERFADRLSQGRMQDCRACRGRW